MSALSIRLPESLHKNAKELAQREGISVNQLISSALAEKLAALATEQMLEGRAAELGPAAQARLSSAFEIDLERCPNCGGELKIIAAILEQPVIEKILTHLGLQARAPPRAPARGQALQAA
jgi:hypothetical protein